MIKLTTSAMGIFLLTPIGCSGATAFDNPSDGTGGSSTVSPPSTGGHAATGGSSTVFYPIMPLGTGGRSATGGSGTVTPPATGGKATTGGSSAVYYPVMPPTSSDSAQASTPSLRDPNLKENDSWWRTAEAALRRT